MSKSITAPRLNLGNQIYLYRLLRDALGCGKQTFITQVEEALAEADMAAYDLGFDDTRALLEAMGDCVKLTVFKGGRVYATVIANEAWDAALEKADQPKQKETGKKLNPRKKKKGDKALKPIKPKHVKRPEPEVAVEAEVKAENGTVPADQTATVAAETAGETQSGDDSAAQTAIASESEIKTEQASAPTAEPQPRNAEIFTLEEEAAVVEETIAEDQSDAEQTAEPTPTEPEPAISLTVIYDPENANAGVQTWESKPVSEQAHDAEAEAEAAADTALDNEGRETKPASIEDAAEDVAAPSAENEPASPVAAETKTESEDEAMAKAKPKLESKPASAVERKPSEKAEHVSAPEPTHQPKTKTEQRAVEKTEQEAPSPAPLPAIPEDYPTDFATEVFCPGPLLHEISRLLPYGADAMGIAGEYYWIARERGTIQASRNRATFALRYTQDGERHEATIRIRRNTSGGMGAPWTIDKVETN